MKKWLGSVASGVLLFVGASPVAFASTNTPTGETISLNNTTLSIPHVISRSSASYVPVWYVMQALKTAGMKSTWDGHAWYITSANSPMTSTKSSNMHGNTSVYINGKQFITLSTFVAADPASKHKTTYVQLAQLHDIFQALNLSADEQANQLSILTPDVKVLADAYANSQTAKQSQVTAAMDEEVTVNLTKSGASQAGSSQETMDIQMKMDMQTGVVNGEKAALITITPSMKAPSTATGANSSSVPALPSTIKEYIQGTKLWINQGNGWQEQKSTEQLIQSLESKMGANQVSFDALHNIKVTKDQDGTTTYSATIDGSSLASTVGAVLGSLSSQMGSTSGSAMTGSVLNNILKSLHGQMSVTVAKGSGAPMIQSDNLTMDLQMTPQQLGSAQAAKALKSIDVHETMTANYTYNDVALTPPADLNTSTSTSQSQSN